MKKLLFMLVAGAMVLPSFSFAQIQGDVNPNSGSDCVSISHNLQYRSRDITTGGDVSTLQDFLQTQGYLNSEPTGYFGILTQAAVKAFQSASGVLNSGYVGPITRTKITSATCGVTPVTSVNPAPKPTPVTPVTPVTPITPTPQPAPVTPIVSAPKISYISPTSGTFGTPVTIYGSGFRSTDTVTVNEVGITPTSVSANGTSIVFTFPSGFSTGVKNVYVDRVGISPSNAVPFTVTASTVQALTPVIQSVGSPGNPNFQFYSGNKITIVGYNFPANATVLIGSTSVIGQTNSSGQNIIFTAPSLSSGVYNLSVIGKAVQSSPVQITILSVPPVQALTPVITGVGSPANNNFEFYPGDRVTIGGYYFPVNATVLIGNTSLTGVTNSSGQNITFTAPSLSAGTYNLSVIGKGVQSDPVQITVLSFQPVVPTISQVQSPAENPNILHPGERATIQGTNLDLGGITVHMLGKAQENTIPTFNAYSGSIDFTIPNISAGVYDLSVIHSGSESNKISVNVVTY